MTSCTGAGLGATEDEAVEADGGLEATRLIGDLALPPKKRGHNCTYVNEVIFCECLKFIIHVPEEEAGGGCFFEAESVTSLR